MLKIPFGYFLKRRHYEDFHSSQMQDKTLPLCTGKRNRYMAEIEYCAAQAKQSTLRSILLSA